MRFLFLASFSLFILPLCPFLPLHPLLTVQTSEGLFQALPGHDVERLLCSHWPLRLLGPTAYGTF